MKDKKRLNEETANKLCRLECMSFNEAIEFLLKNTDLLRTPIIIDKNKNLRCCTELNYEFIDSRQVSDNRKYLLEKIVILLSELICNFIHFQFFKNM